MMISSEIERCAELEREHEAVPPVRASRNHLLQVFLNLLTNAAQALAPGIRGSIRTRTYTSEVGEAVIEVSDSGVGIPSEHLTRIFDPFFTTKAPGQGTGLGLSLCHAFVVELGGQIHVRSEVGTGSTFRVVLPAAANAIRPKADARTAASTPGQRARVLVVDDEPLVCSVLEHVLNEYEVVIVRDARAALDLLCGQQRFDVVLCDLNLPDLSGLDVWRQAIEARPMLRDRFLIMTGGVRSVRQARQLEEASLPVVEKPFDLRVLLGLIDSRARPSQRPAAAGNES
jgi:CheY-like chemotaxis protein